MYMSSKDKVSNLLNSIYMYIYLFLTECSETSVYLATQQSLLASFCVKGHTLQLTNETPLAYSL